MNPFCEECKRKDCPKPFESEKGKPLCFPDPKDDAECFLCLRIDKFLVVDLSRRIWGKRQGALIARTTFRILKEAYFKARGNPKIHCKVVGKSARGLICGALYLAQIMILQSKEDTLLIVAGQRDIMRYYERVTGKKLCEHSIRTNYQNLKKALKYQVEYIGSRPKAMIGASVKRIPMESAFNKKGEGGSNDGKEA